MTTTNRRDATDAQFADELARLERLDVADEGAEERVARAIWDAAMASIGAHWTFHDAADDLREDYRRLARAAIDALKPAPGTDTGTEDALHRVLDLADEMERPLPPGTAVYGLAPSVMAHRIRAAVAGPQRNEVGE